MPTKRAAIIRPGAVIAAKFLLERQLGQGSMGSVWRARHLGLETTVAIKFMAPELGGHPELIMRFAQEARAAAQIRSPHVVGVLDYGTDDDGRPYIAMEFLQGQDLGAALKRQQTLALQDVVGVVWQAARGLARAHQSGVVHRDIKPENLFLARDDDGEVIVKILDFGVAKLDLGADPRHTAFGQTLGSPVYMSPEQAQSLPVDARTDLFSLGVVVYQCLTGELPFEGWTVSEVFKALLNNTPLSPSEREPSLPRSVDAWMERALQKDPSKRFQTALEMAEALEACAVAPSRSSAGAATPSHAAPASFRGPSPAGPPEPARRPAPLLERPQPYPNVGPPSPAAVGLEAPLRQVLAAPEVRAVALLDGSGRGLVCLHAPSAPEVPLEQVLRQVHALSREERARVGDVQLMVLRFDRAVVAARWFGDYGVVALSSERVNVPIVLVLLNTAAQKLARLGELGGGDVSAGGTAGRPPPTPTHATSSLSPTGPPSSSGSVWVRSQHRLPEGALDRPPSSRSPSPQNAAPQRRPEHALLTMKLSLALGKHVGMTAHHAVKREVARFGALHEPQSLLELVNALGAAVDDPARRAMFLREAQELVLGKPRGADR